MIKEQIDGDGNDKRLSAVSSVMQKPGGQQRKRSKFGDCHIFDYQEFVSGKPRLGSEHDVARLKRNFSILNFNVFTYLNLSKQETLDVLEEAAKQEYEESECFICCFLTHGKEGSLSMYDTELKVDSILKCFSRSSCPNLAGKPKIFVFQACRGDGYEEGVVPGDKIDSPTAVDRSVSLADTPDYLDFLLVYSTYEGYVAFKTINLKYKEGNHGSYFVDELCRTLEQFSKDLELLQILTIVNYRVARLFQSSSSKKLSKHRKKQMPGFTSRLTSKVKFNKKIPVYETDGTRNFDKRRKESTLGWRSTEEPEKDKTAYEIKKPGRVKFLFLVNMKSMFDKDLLGNASGLWSSITESGYQSEVLSNWTEKELMDFLNEVQNFSNTDCSICFIACQANGDNLCDIKGKEFRKQNIVERFTGKECRELLEKPKIFIFLMSSLPNKTWESCNFPDGTDGDDNTVPVHSDLLEVAFTIQKSEQLKGVIEKFCKIFGSKSSENFLSQLTEMFNELVKDYGFYSPLDKNVATFCLNSTLTQTLILNKP